MGEGGSKNTGKDIVVVAGKNKNLVAARNTKTTTARRRPASRLDNAVGAPPDFRANNFKRHDVALARMKYAWKRRVCMSVFIVVIILNYTSRHNVVLRVQGGH